MTLIFLLFLFAILSMLVYRFLGDRLKYIPVARGDITILASPTPLNLKSFMMGFISVALIGSSLYVILSGKYDEGTQKWAFGTIGSMIGFWLRPEE